MIECVIVKALTGNVCLLSCYGMNMVSLNTSELSVQKRDRLIFASKVFWSKKFDKT